MTRESLFKVFENPIRALIGFLLFIISTFALITTESAHVSMCMIGAIGYAISLMAIGKPWAKHWASFFFAWIMFYTVYTATSFLVVDLLSGSSYLTGSSNVLSSTAWLYHTVINFVLLLLFVFELDEMDSLLAGFWSAMIVSPVMIVFAWFGRGLFDRYEPVTTIMVYMVVGLILMMIHLFLTHDRKSLNVLYDYVHKFVVISLFVFILVTMAPYLSVMLFTV